MDLQVIQNGGVPHKYIGYDRNAQEQVEEGQAVENGEEPVRDQGDPGDQNETRWVRQGRYLSQKSSSLVYSTILPREKVVCFL